MGGTHWLLLIAALGMFTYILSAFMRPKFPEGKRKTFVENGWTTRIVNAPEGVQLACQKAHLAVVYAIRQQTTPNQLQSMDRISEVCFYFSPKDKDFPPQVGSYLTYIPTKSGFQIPLIIVRTKLFLQVIKTGEPLIQELIQALEPEGDKALYWKQDGGSESLQATAEVIFLLNDIDRS